jgi:hypothetical protein
MMKPTLTIVRGKVTACGVVQASSAKVVGLTQMANEPVKVLEA